ncbi:hypothetical protein NE237_028954 [Protea cynaroides]|uniref:Uncharacterized protein n=1 Tax=Protea cynaroides TaxID=273540 RepID=A0A9Q0GUC4_9MAGN|nr:hypothetical protein NE237_028954 [Protea cynaroides]
MPNRRVLNLQGSDYQPLKSWRMALSEEGQCGGDFRDRVIDNGKKKWRRSPRPRWWVWRLCSRHQKLGPHGGVDKVVQADDELLGFPFKTFWMMRFQHILRASNTSLVLLLPMVGSKGNDKNKIKEEGKK